MKFPRALLVASALSGLALVQAADTAPQKELPDPGFSVKFMDPAVSPAADFGKFAAGGWYARAWITGSSRLWKPTTGRR